MSVGKKHYDRSAYAKMLGNIASDLDTLLTDLCHVDKQQHTKEELPCTTGTIRSADTLGKDSFFSSTGDTSRRQGDAVSSNHSLVSLSDNDCDSVDSGHDGRCRSGPSPLVFDPHHFGPQATQRTSPVTERVEISSSTDEMRPISTVEKLIKTNSIWLLATMSRTGAVHILRDRETGIFIVRKSSQPNSLALSVKSRLSDPTTVDHYLIEGTIYGFRLQGSAHFFHSIPALIAYYIENIDEIPYNLQLPAAIQQARSTRELASLDMLGQDFWMSSWSRKSPSPEVMSGILHKSSSEPINIQRPVTSVTTASVASTQHNTAPSKSASDFSHFMRTQQEMEQYFEKHINASHPEGSTAECVNSSPSLQAKSSSKHETNLVLLKSQVSHSSMPEVSTGQNVSNCSCTSKGVTESGVVSGHSNVLSNQNSPHLNVHVQRFNSTISEGSWALASSPIEKQMNRPFIQSAQNIDIYKSNPSNQPVSISSAQRHLPEKVNKNNTPQAETSSMTKQHVVREGSTKERSWTHPVGLPKLKSNLYFTTNLGLLDIPENSYFTSNLSDKLSDYEDIWRNSCCESDADKMSADMIHDPRAVFDAKVNGHLKKNSAEGRKKVLRKTAKDSSSVRRPASSSRDAVTGGTTGLTALEQARVIAGSTSEDEPAVPVAHVRCIRRMENMFEEEPVPMDTSSTSSITATQSETFSSERHIESIQIPPYASQKVKYVTSHSLDLSSNQENQIPIQDISTHVSLPSHVISQSSAEHSQSLNDQLGKCVYTTTMSVIVSDNASSEQSSKNISNKKKIKIPIGHLSRLKSSSESSLATISSPLYAEPADAVKLRDKNGKVINIHVRRLSAPLAANLIKNNKDQQIKVSQNPQLETILSPEVQTSNNNNNQSKFVFSLSKMADTSKILHSSVGISRSQSMRTTNEMSRLQSKQSWKDRLTRPKLGTKVLIPNLNPPGTSNSKNILTSSFNHSDLENAVFNDSSLAQTSALSRSFPGKFPVSHKSELQRTSCFSESSTVQDLISCALPELSVRPITLKFKKFGDKNDSTPPSEYDNLLVYRESTHSSLGTVYSPPWEVGTVNKLIREPTTLASQNLPPAMDIVERIERWQQMSSCYHGREISEITVANSETTKSTRTKSVSSPTFNQQLIQRQQLLEHQQQIKTDDNNKVTNAQKTLPVGNSVWQQQKTNKNTDLLHKNKDTHHPSLQESATKVIPAPSLPKKITTGSQGNQSPAHRLSSHCPDVVNCHNMPANLNSNTPKEISFAEVSSVHRSVGSDDTHSLIVTGDTPVKKKPKPRSRSESKTPGAKIREYIFKLSGDRQTIFGSTIENFIQCTIESQETNPQYVMRNVRQFMTGIKNYLVKHGEGQLENLIEKERSKLGANEILNIDAIIEQALHVCVLKPLKYHIYRLFVEKYNKNGALEQLSKNIKYARTKTAQDIGVKPGLKLPQNIDLEVIKHYLDLMQRAYSPLQKLQNLLNATSTIYHSVQEGNPNRTSSLGAEDFLPLLIYVIVHCGLLSGEIEADYMWGLLQPSLLTGEGGYYLTTLSSAILILKNFQETHQLAPAQIEGKLPTLSDMQGYLKIAIPDELHGSITWKTLPVRPNMNTRDVCAMVAHKFKITNPQDYGLYLLCDGLESLMADTDCPQIMKGDNLASDKTCYFAFKRLDANIAWPKHMKHSPHN